MRLSAHVKYLIPQSQNSRIRFRASASGVAVTEETLRPNVLRRYAPHAPGFANVPAGSQPWLDLGDGANTLQPLGDAALDQHPASPAVDEEGREGAGDAVRREWVSPVHQVEVQVRGRRVAGVTDTPDLSTNENRLTFAHGDASRR